VLLQKVRVTTLFQIQTNTSMKNLRRLFAFFCALLISTPIAFAQQWGGPPNTTDFISRTGPVQIGDIVAPSNGLSPLLTVAGRLNLLSGTFGSGTLGQINIGDGFGDGAGNLAVLSGQNAGKILTGGLLLGFSLDSSPLLGEIRSSFNQNLALNARGTSRLNFQINEQTRVLVSNSGVLGQVGSGTFGNLADQWSALGSSPFPLGGGAANPYGLRLNWDSDYAIFQMTNQSNRKDAEIVFGDNEDQRFRVVFADAVGGNRTGREIGNENRGGNALSKGTTKEEYVGSMRVASIYTEEMTIDKVEKWPDFVFDETYTPMSLYEIESFVKTNKHLPEIPSAKDVAENGVKVGELQTKLLQKVEELTLHLIELKKENDALKRAVMSNGTSVGK
jgi:trimeric autotransporter adhesin